MSAASDSSPAAGPAVLAAANVAPRARPSAYPAPFAARMAGRTKRALGDAFGLRAFGVNLTTLAPGAASALLHRHDVQDEFVYLLAGTATLVTDDGEHTMRAGDCAGFPAGGRAHRLENRGDAEVVYLEIGDRAPGDRADYPADDLRAAMGADGRWTFTHKDGRPY